MIRLLDANTINKIAAGEVIEKPSSVIKELVENAIDSGASAISVEVKGSGLSFMRVTDNGSGIPKDEVKTAFLRHATSKLVTVEDLLNLSSLGFRGEALASIASVSQVEMISKTKDAITGIRYQIHGGVEISNEEIGCPNGTTIIVRNIFYNTPARKKFMKTDATETGYIYDLICRIAMSHPEISFKLIVNGTNKLFTSGNGKLKDIIYHIYGRDITSNLLELDAQNDFLHISGYIARPCISRGNRSFEGYYVNHRYIKSSVITKAIEDAYRTFVMIHKFPFTEINFDIRPDLLDVNVHPTKMELKFANSPDVYSFTYNAIREALLFKELIPEVSPEKAKKQESFSSRKIDNAPEAFENNRRKAETAKAIYAEPAKHSFVAESSAHYQANTGNNKYKATEEHLNKNLDIDPSIITKASPAPEIIDAEKHDKPAVDIIVNVEDDKSYNQQSLFTEGFLTKEARSRHRLIGQLFKTYWLIEYENKLFIMDQHAAHEKVKFEELLENYKNKKIYSQYIMPPAVVSLNAAEINYLQSNMDFFEGLGYQLEPFGGREYKLTAVPDNLFGLDGRELFIDFIAEASSDLKRGTIDTFISKLSTMACKAAIKGNTEMSFKEADALIDKLLSLENPYTCPHGRPTLISMTESEIEKKFKRIV